MDHKYDEMVTGMENSKGTDEKERNELIAENDKRVMENKSGENNERNVVMEKESSEMVVAQRDEMVMAQRDQMVVTQRDKMVVVQKDEVVVVESNKSAKENKSEESGEMNVSIESS
jgi:hypothetical protein